MRFCSKISYIFLFTGPDAPPGNIVAVAYNATAIQVTFDDVSPTDANGIIEKYRIYYESNENSSETSWIDTSLRRTLIKNLLPATSYNIWVSAFTIEEGKHSKKFLVHTPPKVESLEISQKTVKIQLIDVKKLTSGKLVK